MMTPTIPARRALNETQREFPVPPWAGVNVLDSSFLIAHENGGHEAAAFLQANADEEFIIPSTVYAEYPLGEANTAPEPGLPAVRAEIDWT